MDSIYTPTGVQTTTNVDPYHSDTDAYDLYREAALDRWNKRNQGQTGGSGGLGGGRSLGGGPAPGSLSQTTGPVNRGPNPMEQAAQRAKLSMLESQEQAVVGKAPTRYVTGFNIIPGLTLDPFAMSGAQRQAFLPQGSSNNPSADADAETERLRAEAIRRLTPQFDPYAGSRQVGDGRNPGGPVFTR